MSGIPDHLSLDKHLQTIPTCVLLQIANGELDAIQAIRAELAARGTDQNGRWIGFPAAETLWNSKTAQG